MKAEDAAQLHLVGEGHQRAASARLEGVDVVGPEEPQTAEVEGVPADVAVRYLRELSRTWRKADGGPGWRMLASGM